MLVDVCVHKCILVPASMYVGLNRCMCLIVCMCRIECKLVDA